MGAKSNIGNDDVVWVRHFCVRSLQVECVEVVLVSRMVQLLRVLTQQASEPQTRSASSITRTQLFPRFVHTRRLLTLRGALRERRCLLLAVVPFWEVATTREDMDY
jgi:hypothetical protein